MEEADGVIMAGFYTFDRELSVILKRAWESPNAKDIAPTYLG